MVYTSRDTRYAAFLSSRVHFHQPLLSFFYTISLCGAIDPIPPPTPFGNRNLTDSIRSGVTTVAVGGAGAALGPAVGGSTAGREGSAQVQSVSRRTANLFKSTAGGAAGGAGAPAAAAGTGESPKPVEYTILLHPPLVVENLLPHAGTFELVDQVMHTILVTIFSENFNSAFNSMFLWLVSRANDSRHCSRIAFLFQEVEFGFINMTGITVRESPSYFSK